MEKEISRIRSIWFATEEKIIERVPSIEEQKETLTTKISDKSGSSEEIAQLQKQVKRLVST